MISNMQTVATVRARKAMMGDEQRHGRDLHDMPIARLRRRYALFYTDRVKLAKPWRNHNHEWTVHDLRDLRDRQAEVIAAQEAESISA